MSTTDVELAADFLAALVEDEANQTKTVVEFDDVFVPDIVLEGQQVEAFDILQAFLGDETKKECRIGGFAGTGKTTIIKKLCQTLQIPYAVAAFTGKAVAVLRRKGVYQAQTLHSLLYKVVFDGGKMKMIPRPYLFAKVVIVDEGSMVSTQLYEDLKKHGVKLIFFGDPAQLEPVGDNPNLMRECDYTLTEIHRQAEGSPIITIAHHVRTGGRLYPELRTSKNPASSVFITDHKSDIEHVKFDAAICSKNATRHHLNATRRFDLGRTDPLCVGESVICLQNIKERGLYNGMILTLESIEDDRDDHFMCDLVDDLGTQFTEIPVEKEWFGKNYVSVEQFGRNTIAFDYGYALTCHKSQGSEWGRVLGIDEWLPKIDMARLRYTLITRAAQHLIYLID